MPKIWSSTRGAEILRGFRCALVLFVITSSLSSTGCAAPAKLVDLVVKGDSRELRTRAKDAPPSSPAKPPILLLAFDGVDRSLLYDLLRRGEMPNLAALLGGMDGDFQHAYFSDSLLATLPSSTLAAWTTAMTGVTPAQHGITGNELFIRQWRKFGAPAPVSFSDSAPTLAVYTDNYLSTLTNAPTVYDQMRVKDPNVLCWVAMHQVFSGADRLIVTKPSIMSDAFEEAFERIAKLGDPRPTRGVFEKVDKSVVAAVIDELGKGPVPDVLTVYLSGTDLYAHIAAEGPDEARRAYLRQVVDPAMARLTERLRARDALANRYVVVTSDHGHTEVRYDDAHALAMDDQDDPPAIVRKAGFRLRPFKLDVSAKDDFSAVLAYGGAMAYVYVADRSTCAKKDDVCDWSKPPRYEEDVLPMADAFFTNNEDGSLVPAMKGTLDMILTRRPRPYAEDDLPFEVYVGNGKTMPVTDYLKQVPHPTYVDFDERLRDLAVGPQGERAGDVLLIAHNGDRSSPDQRYYFAAKYRSWHGSPSRQDSEIPFIVANPRRSKESLRSEIEKILGPDPRQQKVTSVLLELRFGAGTSMP